MPPQRIATPGAGKIVTAICWISPEDRESILRTMLAAPDYADIREALAGLELTGFNPADFPMSAKDRILHGHWSLGAMKLVEKLSAHSHVITTIGQHMAIKGMTNGNIHHLGHDDLSRTAEGILVPILDAQFARIKAEPRRHEHLVIVAVSSHLSKMIFANLGRRRGAPSMDGTNIFSTVAETFDALAATLQEVLRIRSLFGHILLIANQSYEKPLDESGLSDVLRRDDIGVRFFSTRLITHLTVMRFIADIVRGAARPEAACPAGA